MTTIPAHLFRHPALVQQLAAATPLLWLNPDTAPCTQALNDVGLSAANVADAAARLARFAPYLAQAFPETAINNGFIESELVPIPHIQAALSAVAGHPIGGTLLLKKDSHLPISGSIKARGGIYAVLDHAERLALASGRLHTEDDYAQLLHPKWRQFFSRYHIAVGSTGNLGLSIGIMGAKLGFRVTVHMSADARAWKKQKLHECGVTVVEYTEDYGMAVEQGRRTAKADPTCYFIDDENSRTLFLGYAVAGQRVRQQLAAQNILVDAEHPLLVYLPCGVGGGPGGVAFGLKLALGDAVHCFFAEPTQSPCMTLGLITGLHEHIAVTDIGLSNQTAADGLAVGRPSGFVGRAMQRLIDGCFTVTDETLFAQLALLAQTERIRLEPSALAGMSGPALITQACHHATPHKLTAHHLAHACHLVWATGGGMVPDEEMAHYLQQPE